MENTQQIIDLVKLNLAPVVDQLGKLDSSGFDLVANRHFWEPGMAPFIFSVIPIFVIFCVWIFMIIKNPFKDEYFKPTEGMWFLFFLYFVVSVIGLCCCFYQMASALPYIMNPEYYAMMEIIQLAK